MSSDVRVRRAALAVWAGGIVAYPTEGVFGLGCDPDNAGALRRLCALKARDSRKGFVVIAGDLAEIESLVIFPSDSVRRRVLDSWPGPCTWILPARAGLNPLLTGGRTTLAVRMTAHPPATALCRLTGALVSTSANRSGCPPIRDPLRCRAVLGRWLDAVAPGAVGDLTGPTEIRDASSGRLIRGPTDRRPDVDTP